MAQILNSEEMRQFVADARAMVRERKPRPTFLSLDGDNGFAEVLEGIARLDQARERWAWGRTQDLLAGAPDCLTLEEKQRATELVWYMISQFPGESPLELLWILAADTTRPRRRGRSSKWAGLEGVDLVNLVEIGLKEMGLTRNSKKGVRHVIAAIRKGAPERYGIHSDETLRKAYYKALRKVSRKAA